RPARLGAQDHTTTPAAARPAAAGAARHPAATDRAAVRLEAMARAAAPVEAAAARVADWTEAAAARVAAPVEAATARRPQPPAAPPVTELGDAVVRGRDPSRHRGNSLLGMPIPDLLTRLLSSPGPSGHETDPARVWREACAEFAEEVAADRVGSSFARVSGTAGGPRLVVVGHIDEIGLHITHID